MGTRRQKSLLSLHTDARGSRFDPKTPIEKKKGLYRAQHKVKIETKPKKVSLRGGGGVRKGEKGVLNMRIRRGEDGNELVSN